jgi:hypothetical protein
LIRAFQKADLPKVCQLHKATFGKDAKPINTKKLSDFYQSVFLDSPFSCEGSPSLVSENHGEVDGFVGVLTRNFFAKNHSYQIRIGSRYMVSPTASALVGASLLRSATKGKLDLFFTDGANDEGRKAMLALGGEEVPLYSFQWLKIIRPFNWMARRLKQRSSIVGLTLQGLSPFLDIPMRILPLTAFQVNEGHPTAPCDVEDLSYLYSHLPKDVLIKPLYQKTDLDWLINFCTGWKTRGEFYIRKVTWSRNESAAFSGYLRGDGIFEILNLWALPNRRGDLLDALFHFVKGLRGVGVQGQIPGGFLSHLKTRGVLFKKGSWAMAKGKDSSLLHSLHAGKIYMGGFEGELWLPSGRRGHE